MRYHITTPRKERTCRAVVKGVGKASPMLKRDVSALIPSAESVCPRKGTSEAKNEHFCKRTW